MIRMIALALCAALPAYAQSSPPLSAKNPQALAAVLKEMGYTTRDQNFQAAVPTMVIEKDEESLVLSFGSCEPLFHLNCGYVVALGSFSDVVAPPADWLAKQNGEFDLIKVWVGDNKLLMFSDGAIIEGWPRQAFVDWIDSINRSGDQLAQEAVEAGLVKK